MKKAIVLFGKDKETRLACAEALTLNFETVTIENPDLNSRNVFAPVQPETKTIIMNFDECRPQYEALFNIILQETITVNRENEQPFSIKTPLFIICDNEMPVISGAPFFERFDVIDLNNK